MLFSKLFKARIQLPLCLVNSVNSQPHFAINVGVFLGDRLNLKTSYPTLLQIVSPANRGQQHLMTTIFLSKSQQTALQDALITNKLLSNSSLTYDAAISAEQQAYCHIAVTLYRFNLQKIKWPYFLNTAINTATDVCQWLTCELVRCQQEYQTLANDTVIIEQSAFFNGVFSEELAYIDTLLGTEVQAK